MPENTHLKEISPEDLASSFQAELTRLEALSLDDETLDLARRYYSQKERKSMNASSFCGPHRSFPITSQADVSNAARLIGHADNPDAVKSCIIRKAKASGWSLPDAWTSGGDGDRADEAELERAKAAAVHDPYTGRHSHGHPHEIDGYAHEHSHEHTGDAEHDHSHIHTNRAEMPMTAFLYAPIVRIDKSTWEVEGVATSEAVDSFDTVFSYKASKKAFQKWIERTANVREMHEKKAVAKGIGIFFDDDKKQIIVRSRVSRGAPDTWAKIEDGVLSGYSVGATKPTWSTVEREGKKYPYLVGYDLAELSLVDSASNPDAHGLVIARNDGLSDVIDVSEQETPQPEEEIPPPAAQETIERAGARISHITQGTLHNMRDAHLQGAQSVMNLCGCDECQGGCSALDPDGDGDIDIIDGLDVDGDDGKGQDNWADWRAIEATIQRQLAPIIQRQQHFLAQLAAQPEFDPELIRSVISTEINTYLTAAIAPLTEAVERIKEASSQSEERSILMEVKETVERIAGQPQPGGPVLNAGIAAEKRLANDPRQYMQGAPDQAAVKAVLDRLQASGALNTVEAQTAAASLLIQPMPGRIPT